MTPTWAVILVGLAGGLFGSMATTLLTISHERAAEFRSHQLNAADEFSIATMVALQQARNAAGEVMKAPGSLVNATGGFKAALRSHFDSANDAVDVLFAKRG